MNVTELQAKYIELKSKLDESKLSMARAQANYETAEKERDAALNKILEMTDSKTIEDARNKFEKLEENLKSMLKEAEELLK